MTASPGHIRTLSLAEEQVARLVAAQELPANAIAKRAKLARSTLYLWLADPAMQARIAALREEFRAQAMVDEPFADKRARVVTLGALARHVLTTLRETNLEETYYYGPDALEAKRFDAPRMETFRKFLRDIAEEMGDRGGAQAGTTVGVVVKVYTDPRLERPLEADWDDAPPLATAPTSEQRPYAPVGHQKTIFACRERELICVGPADTGKTRTIFEKLHRALENYPGGRVLYCRKERASCTDTGLVTFEERVLPPGHYLRRGPKRDGRHAYKYTNGSELVVGGLDDMEKHRSSEYDWVYVQEVSEATEDDWENLLRATSGRAGAFPYPQLIGDLNPEYPMHWVHRRCDEGTAAEVELTHADNPAITEERLDALRRMTGARRERFYLGRRVVDIDGSYFGKLLHDAEEDGRLVSLPPGTDPVYVSWDFGVSDFTSLWFWQRARTGTPLLLDYYESQGEGLRHYVQVMQRKAARFGYVYGGMVYPHDAEARLQGEMAESRLDVLRRLLPGVRDFVVPRVQDIMDRVQASRDCIAVATFDNHRAPVREGARDAEARNTAQGVQRLLMYQRPYSKATGTYGTQPRHNEASHAADAFGTGAMALDWMHHAPRQEQAPRDIPYLDRWEDTPRYGRVAG